MANEFMFDANINEISLIIYFQLQIIKEICSIIQKWIVVP